MILSWNTSISFTSPFAVDYSNIEVQKPKSKTKSTVVTEIKLLFVNER